MPSEPSTTSAPGSSGIARNCDPRVERTRAAIVEAAVEHLLAEGPGAVTHANVATSANVSRTTVYKHWPTRSDLLRSAIDAIRESTPPLAALTGHIRVDLELLFIHTIQGMVDNQRAPLIAIMMERSLHDPAVRSVRDSFMDEFEPVFQTIINTAIESGEIRADIDLDLALASIMGSFLFLRFMSPQEFEVELASRVLDEFVTSNSPT
ncbi:MAG: hypothetical protein DRJ50_00375 [Actinobacteria bacterium]|nr:MAG: hypothetical protein DRJ50_00375 [Actinomycetota bacterium]